MLNNVMEKQRILLSAARSLERPPSKLKREVQELKLDFESILSSRANPAESQLKETFKDLCNSFSRIFAYHSHEGTKALPPKEGLVEALPKIGLLLQDELHLWFSEGFPKSLARQVLLKESVYNVMAARNTLRSSTPFIRRNAKTILYRAMSIGKLSSAEDIGKDFEEVERRLLSHPNPAVNSHANTLAHSLFLRGLIAEVSAYEELLVELDKEIKKRGGIARRNEGVITTRVIQLCSFSSLESFLDSIESAHASLLNHDEDVVKRNAAMITTAAIMQSNPPSQLDPRKLASEVCELFKELRSSDSGLVRANAGSITCFCLRVRNIGISRQVVEMLRRVEKEALNRELGCSWRTKVSLALNKHNFRAFSRDIDELLSI